MKTILYATIKDNVMPWYSTKNDTMLSYFIKNGIISVLRNEILLAKTKYNGLQLK